MTLTHVLGHVLLLIRFVQTLTVLARAVTFCSVVHEGHDYTRARYKYLDKISRLKQEKMFKELMSQINRPGIVGSEANNFFFFFSRNI